VVRPRLFTADVWPALITTILASMFIFDLWWIARARP
jgi:hypothetical protein